MNREDLQFLSRERVREAEALLAHGLWSGADHIVGYAVECGLKSCILSHLYQSGIIFKDRKYLDRLAKCWTHDLVQLMDLASLTTDFGEARSVNPLLDDHWAVVKDWQEISRYEQKTEKEARELFKAITIVPDGVLPWIQSRW